MNTDTQTPENTQGGAAAPAASETVNSPAPAQVPRSDAEAEAMERDAAANAEGDGGAKPKEPDADPTAKPPEDKQKGQAAAFIKKLKDEARELRRKAAEQEYELQRYKASQSGDAAEKTIPEGFTQTEPKLEDFDFDPTEFGRAWGRWDAAREAAEKQAFDKQFESKEQVQETLETYEQRIADFAAEHDDFVEVVNSIKTPLSRETQLAIMRHEKGAEISYYLGKNEDEAFNLALASVNPALAEVAVERLASRMTAAQSKAPSAGESDTPAPQVPDVPGFKPSNKSVSKAPAPTPTLSGKSPGEVPAEKMTDDDWYKQAAERERKR